MPRSFQTIGEELREPAAAMIKHLQNRGYRVRVERKELGFPYMPIAICKRQQTMLIIEIADSVQEKRLKDWVMFGESCSNDIRLALCVPGNVSVSNPDERFLRDNKIGLYIAATANVVERIPPQDLALNLALPVLASLPSRVKSLLGSAYEQFERSQWRECFGDACQALEAEARTYLRQGLKRGRIVVVTKKGITRKIPDKEIHKMTMGVLAGVFAQIRSPNHADSQIAQALSALNDDRVGEAHHKRKASTETRLRRNVGRHMWTVVAALKYALNISA